jgi:RNA polymerase sigma factor (sigma-70 family)
MTSTTPSPACPSQVLAEHQKWLQAVLFARLRSQDAVEEVMQEVAFAAVNRQTQGQTLEQLGPWLYRVALVQVLLHRRKTGRRKRLMEKFAENSFDQRQRNESPNPLQWLLMEERREAVRQSMEQLPDRDREVLLLKYSEGLSYEQIAERLGQSPSAVQSRLHRARGRLRQQLLAQKLLEIESSSDRSLHATPKSLLGTDL